MRRALFLAVTLLASVIIASAAEDRDTKVRRDRQEIQEIGTWIYNDLAKALTEAAVTGRPILVVFRCIP